MNTSTQIVASSHTLKMIDLFLVSTILSYSPDQKNCHDKVVVAIENHIAINNIIQSISSQTPYAAVIVVPYTAIMYAKTTIHNDLADISIHEGIANDIYFLRNGG